MLDMARSALESGFHPSFAATSDRYAEKGRAVPERPDPGATLHIPCLDAMLIMAFVTRMVARTARLLEYLSDHIILGDARPGHRRSGKPRASGARQLLSVHSRLLTWCTPNRQASPV